MRIRKKTYSIHPNTLTQNDKQIRRKEIIDKIFENQQRIYGRQPLENPNFSQKITSAQKFSRNPNYKKKHSSSLSSYRIIKYTDSNSYLKALKRNFSHYKEDPLLLKTSEKSDKNLLQEQGFISSNGSLNKKLIKRFSEIIESKNNKNKF